MDQEKKYLLLKGYHEVAAVSDILTGYHIRNKIVRAPIRMSNGCSFAVLIDACDEEMARYIINKIGMELL